MAKIIKADGSMVEIQPRNGRYFKFRELQKIVDGHIEILTLNGNEIMVVNEEGKIHDLPLNLQATELFGLDVIVGDVLVCNDNEVK